MSVRFIYLELLYGRPTIVTPWLQHLIEMYK